MEALELILLDQRKARRGMRPSMPDENDLKPIAELLQTLATIQRRAEARAAEILAEEQSRRHERRKRPGTPAPGGAR